MSINIIFRHALSRRTVLRQSGVALALPLLEAMQPALAEETVHPPRFVGILNYFSFHTPYLFPAETGYNYKLTPYLELLREHRQDFTIISGLSHPDVRDGHASDRSFFTGAPHPLSPSFRNTISLDQLAARQIGRNTRYPSLNLATSAGFSCSYTSNGVAIPAETSAARMFAKLFITGTPAEIAEELARIREGRSILDRLSRPIKSLASTVSPGDREKLDQYYTGVRELEQRLQREEDYAGRPKPAPRVEPVRDPGPGEETLRFGALLDVARLALETDLTRVVTLYFVGTSKTPSRPGESFAYHDLSHHGQDSGKIGKLAILERDLIRQWGASVARIKQSRLLDSTMVVFGAAMGNASSHDATNLPILVAGGKLRHGQHIAHNPLDPPPLSNLWVQVLRHLGLQTERFASSKATGIAGLL